MALNNEIDVLKAELSQYKVNTQRLKRENRKLKRLKENTGQNEFRNLRYELKNVKKKNNEMEKRICIIEKENAVLKNELELANGQPSDQDISDTLAEIQELEIEHVIGNRTLHQRLDRNLKDFVVDPFFYDEQNVLFRHRTEFFFRTYGRFENNEVMLWTDGYNDHCGDGYTVPHQVTKNFDEVATKYLNIHSHPHDKNFKPVFFKRDKKSSEEACSLFEEQSRCFLFDNHESLGSNFQNYANMIVQLFDSERTHSKSLEQLAMKSVLENGISFQNLPESLQVKAKCGYLTLQSPIPEYLGDEGRYWYEVMLTKFGVKDANFKYSLKRRKEFSFSNSWCNDEPTNILGFV